MIDLSPLRNFTPHRSYRRKRAGTWQDESEKLLEHDTAAVCLSEGRKGSYAKIVLVTELMAVVARGKTVRQMIFKEFEERSK
jgi:hypothetical protein